MAGDPLSDVFDVVGVRGVLSGGFAVRGPWVSRADTIEAPLKLAVMVRGRSRLSTDGVPGPLELEPGDVAVLNGRSWLEMRGGDGAGPRREVVPETGWYSADPFDPSSVDAGADVVVGGRVDLNAAGRALLQQALPPLGHVRAPAAAASTLRAFLDRLCEEVSGHRLGSAFAVRQFGQLLILEVLRTYLDGADLPQGWLRVLTDARLSPAVRRIHDDPGRPWRLEELAHSAAMSRTAFAERFRLTAGVPPLTYLHRWRMVLAQRALRDGDVRVGALAAELGYSSEAAFSTAFKRRVGESPLRYRHRTRPGPSIHPGPAPDLTAS